jgi:putative restriction endonuclease
MVCVMMIPAATQAELRREAMAWLAIRTNDGAESMTSQELLDFRFRGEPFRLMDAQAGIRKPAGWSSALSIRTVYTPEGRTRPYEDRVAADGLVRYKWRGLDPNQADNRALRAAMHERVPLIWFFGVGTATYKPIYPIYLLWEEPDLHQFAVDPDVARGLVPEGSRLEENLKRYVMREVRQRLHQPVFRATVLRAYESRCAVCNLGHSELLDAAHIVADRLDEGIPSVRNGLAMCKIHHAAFDSRILGVRPDRVVQIRRDLLEEIDGPMLKYGLQRCHGEPLRTVPRSRSERPDPDLLALSFSRFLEAG